MIASKYEKRMLKFIQFTHNTSKSSQYRNSLQPSVVKGKHTKEKKTVRIQLFEVGVGCTIEETYRNPQLSTVIQGGVGPRLPSAIHDEILTGQSCVGSMHIIRALVSIYCNRPGVFRRHSSATHLPIFQLLHISTESSKNVSRALGQVICRSHLERGTLISLTSAL